MVWPESFLSRLDSYMLKRILPVIEVTLALAMFMLLSERLFRLLELTLGMGVSALAVIRLLMDLVPHYVRLVMPAGLFLGVLLTFRGLSADSELCVIEGCGIGLARLARAPLALAIILSAAGLVLTGYVEPFARYLYHARYYDIANGIVRAGLEEGVFVSLPNGYTVRVDRTRARGREFTGFFGYRETQDGKIEVLTARYGVFQTGDENDPMALRLFDGRRSHWAFENRGPETIAFDRFDLPIILDDVVRFRRRGLDERELTIDELWMLNRANRDGRDIAADPSSTVLLREAQRQVHPAAAAAEFHGRLVYSLSISFMPLMAIPFAVVNLRSSRMGGLASGLVVLVTYQKTLDFGEELASVSQLPAAAFLWSAFSVFAVGSAYLFMKTAAATGQTPYQRFEERVARVLGAMIRPFRIGSTRQG